MIKMGGIICNQCRVVIRPVRADDSGDEHYCDRCKVGEPWLRGATEEYQEGEDSLTETSRAKRRHTWRTTLDITTRQRSE